MLVANSFDLWQKDAFFSAAEEVQQSADIMESAYRTWLKAKREGLMPHHLDELSRELQMALGTAKWQLEEFERAVCLSYQKNVDGITITRHRQFVSAMEDQISHVETALRESLNKEGKKPFRWVDLEEEDCDELALFLSASPGISQDIKDEGLKHAAMATSSFSGCNTEEVCNLGSKNSSKLQISNPEGTSKELIASIEKGECLIKLKEGEILETREEVSHQSDQVTSNRRAWSSAGTGALEIVIDDSSDRQNNVFTESTPKEKVSTKHFFWSSRGENYDGAKGTRIHMQMKMINWIKQHLRGGHRSPRQQVSPVLLVNSTRYILAFTLIIFLAVPFLLYST